MKKMSETVVFFGSGPVAAKSLGLLAQDFNVEAVVTKPKPPHHKGSFPVLQIAQKLHLKTHKVSNKTELSQLLTTKPFNNSLGVLIDFGIIVSQDVIDYFVDGIINSHFSVLPEWRGADPISFAILSGQKSTGVSLMVLVEAMDEGPLIAFGEYELPADITTPELTEHLINFSHGLLQHELPKYVANHRSAPQSVTGRDVSYSRKLTKEDGIIDWHKPAAQIEREIRAFADWPKSRATLGSKEVIITKARVSEAHGKPGKVSKHEKQLLVHTGDGSLIIERLKPAGKKEMSSAAFLAGYRL